MAYFLTHDVQHKPLDIITLFHKAASPASMRVAAALRQASAAASETSTEDQASDHTAQSNAVRRPEFKLEITEDPPTPDQLQTILDYVGKERIGSVVKGATDPKEALRKLKESADNFQRPVVCPSFGLFALLFLAARLLTDLRRLLTGTMARWGRERTSRRFSRCSMPFPNKCGSPLCVHVLFGFSHGQSRLALLSLLLYSIVPLKGNLCSVF